VKVDKVRSKDGTTIAFDKQGSGPALILVDGAMATRSSGSNPELARLLAEHFTVYTYDRRGRGDSGDTQPYAVKREIEDVDALIDEAGGSACLFGQSSGGCLAMEASIALGDKVKKLAMYEAPYNDDPEAQKVWGEYIRKLTDALASGRRGDAVALFMALVGLPASRIEEVRHAPFWAGMEAVAHTLEYDHTAIMGKDGSIPAERAARVHVPTLVMAGGDGAPFMQETAKTLSKTIPGATLRTLEGQTHEVHAEALAPVLVEFFAGRPDKSES
jgi:pimeloyl-ACP methyl ester carboxylesterase